MWVEALFEFFDQSMQLDDAPWSVVDNLKSFGSVETQCAPPCFRVVGRIAACLEFMKECSDVVCFLMCAWARSLAERRDRLSKS